MVLRTPSTARAEAERKNKHLDLLGFISFIVNQYRIIADYNRRAVCVADCEEKIVSFNGADKKRLEVMLNNNYFGPWVALVCVCCYMWLGGMALINAAAGITLGMFLANIQIIETVANSYSSIYGTTLQMQSCIDSLRHITKLMNLPTDLQDRQQANRKRRKKTAELTNELKQRYPQEKTSLDRQPIVLEDIEFQYPSKSFNDKPSFSRVNLLGKITLQQGTLTAFVGAHGHGKTTLLKVMGGVILPDDGICFIPSHLRVLCVRAETLFYRGTLKDNLLFGMDKDDNQNTHCERALALLNMFGITEQMQHYIDKDEERPWAEVLSQSECQILNLTRAFVFNPEVLCIDKPTSVFGDHQAAKVMQLLKEFVSNKGLGLDLKATAKRRPRTCVVATERSSGLEVMDRIFKISQEKGIEEKTGEDPIKQQQQQTEAKEGTKA